MKNSALDHVLDSGAKRMWTTTRQFLKKQLTIKGKIEGEEEEKGNDIFL